MRERVVDLALLVGLVIVCVLIVFALFSPASFNVFRSTPSQTVTTPETSETTETPTAETTPPVIPSEGADGTVNTSGETTPTDAPAEVAVADEAEAATDPVTETEDAAADSEAENSEAAADSEAENSEVAGETAAETAAPAAPGSVQLERIGFSFVTGNTHACGVVLEAWQHVAISRDLLERYPCGSEVTLTLDEPVDGRSTVTAVVGDTMNPDNANTVNIYVGTDEPAQEYGVQTGQLSAQ